VSEFFFFSKRGNVLGEEERRWTDLWSKKKQLSAREGKCRQGLH
jgi:hypothetical protein